MTARRSLWLLPTDEAAAPFAEWIARLAARTGSPPFAPHVTLVGHAPSTEGVAATLATFAPFDVTLVALADSDEKFRCVTVEAAADNTLTQLRTALVDSTGAEPTVYAPHLSLLYAELPATERSALRASVHLRLPRTVAVDAVSLVDTSETDPTAWSARQTWRLG